MLIQIQTTGNGVVSINVSQIVKIEPLERGGTHIHFNGGEKVYSGEDFFDLEKRIKEVFKEIYRH